MVELSGVTVRRGRWPRQRAVISDLTWSAGDAERTVLMGANGAGKSTLLQVLAGLIRPAGGQVRRPETFAYVPQATHMLRGATVVQQVEYMAWLAGRPARDARRAARGALAAVGLSGLAERSSRELSGGQARRMALAQALASPGEYLLLDEPTVGLDPVQRAAFHDVLVASGRPFLMTTHLVDAVWHDVLQSLADGTEPEYGPRALLHQRDPTGTRARSACSCRRRTGRPSPRRTGTRRRTPPESRRWTGSVSTRRRTGERAQHARSNPARGLDAMRLDTSRTATER